MLCNSTEVLDRTVGPKTPNPKPGRQVMSTSNKLGLSQRCPEIDLNKIKDLIQSQTFQNTEVRKPRTHVFSTPSRNSQQKPTLRVQVPPEKGFYPPKTTQSTSSEGVWTLRATQIRYLAHHSTCQQGRPKR